MVAVTLDFQDDGSERTRPQHPELGVFEPIDGSLLGPGSIPPSVRMLVSEGVETWAPVPVHVAIGRTILGPGARVFPPNGETLFVAVESGTLDLTGSEARTVAAGQGLVVEPGSGRALGNAGPGLLELLVLTIAPVVV